MRTIPRTTGARIAGLVLAVATAAYAGRGNGTIAAVTDANVDTVNPPTTIPAVVPTTMPVAHAGVNLSDKQVIVADSGTVEIHVSGANLLEVLQLISRQTQKNIIASKDVTGTVTANLYNVTVPEALDAILQANGFVYRERGNFIYVYSAKELAEMDRASRVMSTQVFHLYYIPAATAMTMIKPVLSSESQVAFSATAVTGIDQSGTKNTGGNSASTDDTLVVTDYADNLDRVRKVLKEVDRRPQQILIEATILSVSLTDNNSMGVDFTMLGGVKFDNLLQTAADTISQASSGTLLNKNGTGAQQYGIGGTSFTNQLPPGGLRVGYLSNSVSVFVQALEAVNNTSVLSNPKVLAINKQQGEVIVGRQDGYLTSTVTETAKVETVQFIDTGTRLIFRPYIGDDGFIRMEIHPEDSSGGLNGSNLPFKITTEVTSNVMVKDGHTIVIGGLFRDASATARGQVPLLGDIPFIGTLFKQQQDTTGRQEVIILLTPHIVKDDSAYSDLAQAEMKKAEDYRVGIRKGMMFFSRERLAETAYENAVKELNKPKPDRNLALWHLNAATNLNPTYLEAIELKEKTSGKRLTESDNSSIRSFVSRSILADQGPVPNRPAVIEVGAVRRGSGDPAPPAAPVQASLPTDK